MVYNDKMRRRPTQPWTIRLSSQCFGVRAATNPQTSRAPLSRKIRDEQRRLDPDVQTSSTSSTLRGKGLTGNGASAGPTRRSALLREACGASGLRTRRRSSGSLQCRATDSASTLDGSNPLRLRPAFDDGTQVTQSTSWQSTALAIIWPVQRRKPVRLPYLARVRAWRAVPS